MKVIARILIFILGLLIFTGLLLPPVTASLAQGVEKLGDNAFSHNNHDGFQINQMAILTDTVTSTPTDTPTETATLIITSTATSTATSTDTPTVTPTETPTSTPTPTGTSTVTGSPTSTSTSTSTPTGTSTQPTSTRTPTATVNPGASLSVTVVPNQAKVGESLTFTVKVGNSGSVTTANNVVADSFPTFVDVTSVETTKGTITRGSHTFSAIIGDVNPAEIITITTVVKVNSTLSRTENLTNIVTLTYDQRGSKNASVAYTVVFQTLPGTGELPLNWREERVKPGAMIPGILLMGLGGILLIMVVWSKGRSPKDKLWMSVCGALLILVGFVAGGSASGWFQSIGQAQDYQITPTSEVSIAQAQPGATNLPWMPASAFSTPDAVIPIVTLPDYPIPTPKITITPQPGEVGPDTSAIERIVIPALFLDTVVKYVPYDGFTWLISGLRQEIAWMGNTSWPGLGSNTGLAGHVTVAGMGDGPFRHLDELPNGELVLLYTEKNIYTYQVRESRVTDAGDMSVTLATENPQISLITCIDWDEETHTYLNRLVVIADLLISEPITMGSTR